MWKKIHPNYIKQLIKYGKTDFIKGFKSKKGAEFEASLILKQGKIELNFEKGN